MPGGFGVSGLRNARGDCYAVSPGAVLWHLSRNAAAISSCANVLVCQTAFSEFAPECDDDGFIDGRPQHIPTWRHMRLAHTRQLGVGTQRKHYGERVSERHRHRTR